MTAIEIKSIQEEMEKKINVHGELHLDATQTKLLFSWMKRLTDTVQMYDGLMRRLLGEKS